MSGTSDDFNASAGEDAGTLLEAVRNDDLAAAVALLEKGVRLDEKAYCDEVLENRYRIAFVKPFVEAGMNVNATDEYGNTALALSSVCNDFPLAKFLVERGAGLEMMNKGKSTALDNAAINGRLDIVELLLDHGALLYKDYGGGYHVPIRAANGNSEDEVTALLQAAVKKRAQAVADEAAAQKRAHYSALRSMAPKITLRPKP